MLDIDIASSKFSAAIVLIMDAAGDLLEVLHVCPQQQVAQRDEVAVAEVLDCRETNIYGYPLKY